MGEDPPYFALSHSLGRAFCKGDSLLYVLCETFSTLCPSPFGCSTRCPRTDPINYMLPSTPTQQCTSAGVTLLSPQVVLVGGTSGLFDAFRSIPGNRFPPTPINLIQVMTFILCHSLLLITQTPAVGFQDPKTDHSGQER